MGRRRGCLIAVGGIFGLLLVCCLVGWFVLLPQLQGDVADGIGEGVATQVAEQLGETDIEPGTYTISVAEMEQQLEQNLDDNQVDSVEISVTEQQLVINMIVNNQALGYTGNVTAENGELVVTDMEASEGVLGFFLPGDTFGGAIEDGVNSYFAARNMEIESIELGDDEIIVEAVPAGGA